MNALVMYDRESRSLWSQFLSQAVSGELAGTKLETIPLTLTTWEKWKETHPETVALRKGSRSGDPYDSYYFSRAAGVIGESNKDSRLPTKELVLGLGFDTNPVAFPHSKLRSEKLVHHVTSGHARNHLLRSFYRHSAGVWGCCKRAGTQLQVDRERRSGVVAGRSNRYAVDPVYRSFIRR